jgi:hypothetical protein
MNAIQVNDLMVEMRSPRFQTQMKADIDRAAHKMFEYDADEFKILAAVYMGGYARAKKGYD